MRRNSCLLVFKVSSKSVVVFLTPSFLRFTAKAFTASHQAACKEVVVLLGYEMRCWDMSSKITDYAG
jgi:hypothetical protein